MTSNIGSTFRKLATVGFLVSFGAALIVTQARGEELLQLEQGDHGVMSLKSDIRIDAEFVTLADLFHLTGPKGAINVIRAPKPGAKVAIPAGALARFVGRQGLQWDNAMRLPQVIVTRNSTVARVEEIRDILELAFDDMGLDHAVDLKFHNRNLSIHMPIGVTPDLTVEALTHNANTGHFSAGIRTPADNGETLLTMISGQTIEVQTIPILTRPIPRGEIITAADLKSERMPLNRMGANVATRIEDIIGKESKRALRPNQPLRVTDLRVPTLIKKGAMVTMTFETEGIKLANIGRALETGGAGDIINVINPRSHRTVMARITGNNRVSVTLSSIQIASAQ